MVGLEWAKGGGGPRPWSRGTEEKTDFFFRFPYFSSILVNLSGEAILIMERLKNYHGVA